METEPPLPSAPELMQEFVQRHQISLTDMVLFEELGIVSISAAVLIINRAYRRLDDGALADPTVGFMLNLLHRNIEHAEASIVAFVTGCGASAEVIARASVESSVNMLYILSGDPISRLRAYFDHYLTSVDAQVRNWRSQACSRCPRSLYRSKTGRQRRTAPGGRLYSSAYRRTLAKNGR